MTHSFCQGCVKEVGLKRRLLKAIDFNRQKQKAKGQKYTGTRGKTAGRKLQTSTTIDKDMRGQRQ